MTRALLAVRDAEVWADGAARGGAYVVKPPATVASPLCCYERKPCWKGGRAIYGPPEVLDGCVNRSITCLTCGATGVESRNTEPRE